MDSSKRQAVVWLNNYRCGGNYQALLRRIAALTCAAIYNAAVNMRARGIPMGFEFWNDVAGFDINLHLIDYSNRSTYGQALWVGLLTIFPHRRNLHSVIINCWAS